MEDLLFTIDVVIPMFLIMGTGYALKRFNIVSDELIVLGNKLTYEVLLPVSLFNSLVGSDFSKDFEPGYIIFTLGAVFIFFFASMAIMPFFTKDRTQLPIIDQAMIRSNLVVFGFPLCAAIYGAAGTSSIGILTAFLSPVANAMAVIFFAMYSSKIKSSVKDIFVSVVSSPLIICTFLGAAFVLLKIPMPKVFSSALSDIGGITTPLALLLLGANFTFSGLKSKTKPLTIGIIGRHFIIPAIALTAAYFMGFEGPAFVSMIAVFAGPVASSTFAMCRVYGADHDFGGQYVVVSSAFSVVSIFASVFIGRVLGII